MRPGSPGGDDPGHPKTGESVSWRRGEAGNAPAPPAHEITRRPVHHEPRGVSPSAPASAFPNGTPVMPAAPPERPLSISWVGATEGSGGPRVRESTHADASGIVVLSVISSPVGATAGSGGRVARLRPPGSITARRDPRDPSPPRGDHSDGIEPASVESALAASAASASPALEFASASSASTLAASAASKRACVHAWATSRRARMRAMCAGSTAATAAVSAVVLAAVGGGGGGGRGSDGEGS